MKFFKLQKKELEYMATLEWDPLMEYLGKKYGVEYRDEVRKRLCDVMQDQRSEKQRSKKLTISDELKEKLK